MKKRAKASVIEFWIVVGDTGLPLSVPFVKEKGAANMMREYRWPGCRIAHLREVRSKEKK